ncbi:polysaccharide deacetylase family protein [Flavobacterium sp. GCM10027622]|uniref:polysaccharide deacetylase family protein n=1 Tax=unclassified Flavobacterium TaxID=196869 RepID=UPI00360642CD
MMFYWIKTPGIVKWLFHNQTWSIPNIHNKIYLTFDDGPTPGVTEWVLDLLKKENIKATFFCIGKNIELYPNLFQKIQQHGHNIGNHTFNHQNGWKTKTSDYLQNIEQCKEAIETFENTKTTTKLFRPPYGKITTKQSGKLRKLGYKIIMWDVLTADFDTTITPEKCLENAIQKVEPGSIIVFHDSIKARNNLEYALPKAIRFLKEKGYVFELIGSD